ncbi:MAG: hypothetical protein WAL32_11710 [Terriglobales bacterium]
MKLGTENRNKLIAAAGLGVVALVLVGRMLFPSQPSYTEAVVAPPVASAPASRIVSRTHAGARRPSGPPHSIDPSLRYDWLKASEDTQYQGTGRNIFMVQADIPQPLAKAQTDAEKKAAEQHGPPPPPPINLKFYGFASSPGEPKRVFLSQGEDIFIAVEGQTIDRRYKVLHISPVSVEIEDVLSNNRQMIPLSQG